MLAPIVHILPLTTLRRERVLPVPGRVTANIDQKVSALDVVAEAHYGQEHLMIDVARILGIQKQAAQRLIQVRAGEVVSKGQVIAQRLDLLPLTLRAPSNGRVILTGSGRVLMEADEGTFELRAGIPGRISRQVSERGVEITFNGGLVQAVWGNGQMGVGLLLPVISAPDELLTLNKIDVSLRGSVLLAGHCNDASALKVAGDLPVRGIILGSLSPVLISQAMQVNYPIIVVDGFGLKPMDNTAFNLLTTNAKREVTLNAEQLDRQSGVRPEIYIPLPVTQEPSVPRDLGTFSPGQSIRLTREPRSGAVGTLSKVLPGWTALPSGLRAAAAEVKLDSGDQIVVPLANLEVIG
jgi:hypothetical protein